MSTSKEVVEEKIPWIPIVILTIVFSFISPIWVMMLPPAAVNWYAPGIIACKLFLPVLPLILIMATSVCSKSIRLKIRREHYTFLYAVAMSVAVFGKYDSWPVGDWFPMIIADRLVNPTYAVYWPWFIAPRAEVLEAASLGGVAVPWVDWIPTIVWWWIYMFSYVLFFMSLGSIFRRHIIDIERLPFPQSLPAISLIEGVTTPGKRLSRFFAVGVALGVIAQLPIFLAVLFPWFPDIYGWRTNTCGMGSSWITAGSALAPIIGFAMYNKNPLYVAMFYMAPLKTLFSGWLCYLIFVILMQIAYTMGYYTGIEGLDGCGRVWCGTISYRVGAPFKWDVFTSAGVSTGIALMYLILNYRYIAETFKAAMRRVGSKLDAGEPISYRNAYIILAVSIALQIAIWIGCEVSAVAALTIIASSFILVFITTYVYARIGYVAPAGSWFYYGPIKMAAGWPPPSPLNTGWVMAIGFGGYPLCESGKQIAMPFLTSLHSYKVASMTGVSNRSIFKVVLLANAIGILTAMLGMIWAMYTFGARNLPSFIDYWGSSYFDSRVNPDSIARRPAYEPWIPNMIAGIIFACILSFLNARFLWFPIDPFGFLLATDGHALIEGIWDVLLAAWILKLLTLRIGGAKLYEDMVIPVATGFIVGTATVAFLGGLVYLFRFFVPF